MQKIFSLILITLFLIGCSDDDDNGKIDHPTDTKEEVQQPIVDQISTKEAHIGDTITINGSNFDPKETYNIQFNGVEGSIQEVNENYIKVEIPNEASSGDITLIFNDKTTIIGKIKIISSTLFAIKTENDKPSELIQINPITNEQIKLFDFEKKIRFHDLIYNKQTHQILGMANNGDENTGNKLYTMNLEDNTFSFITLEDKSDHYRYKIFDVENNILYAVKEIEDNGCELITIDLNSGEENNLMVFKDTNHFDDLAFDKEYNQIIAMANSGDGNKDNKLYTITLNDKHFSTITLDDGSKDIFYKIIKSNNGILYATTLMYYDTSEFIKIDPETGKQTQLFDFKDSIRFQDLIYNKQTNQVLGMANNGDGNTGNKLYTIDIENNSFSSITLDDGTKDIFYSIIMTN